jgi:hypothetical protein
VRVSGTVRLDFCSQEIESTGNQPKTTGFLSSLLFNELSFYPIHVSLFLQISFSLSFFILFDLRFAHTVNGRFW